MSEQNIKINVKTPTGYDTLYPQTKSDMVLFDKSNSNLNSNNTNSAIKEVNTKVDNTKSLANTNKTSIGTLSGLETNNKENLVKAINEVHSRVNVVQSTTNTNKNNIGILSSLKTAIKDNIVNAINNLYDITIGKTLKTLNEVSVVTEEGYYVDALAVKELNNKVSSNVQIVDVIPCDLSYTNADAPQTTHSCVGTANSTKDLTGCNFTCVFTFGNFIVPAGRPTFNLIGTNSVRVNQVFRNISDGSHTFSAGVLVICYK